MGNELPKPDKKDLPLFDAIMKKNILKVKQLLDDGANPNIKLGEKPLILHALDRNNFNIIEFLLKKEVSIDKETLGVDILLYYLNSQKPDIEIIKLLLKYDVDINSSGYKGMTPLLYAISFDNMKLVKLFINNKVDLNQKTKNGLTPLMICVLTKRYEMAKLLIENGADLNIQDNSGNGITTYIINCSNVELLKMVIEKGVNLNQKNNFGRNVIFSAINIGNDEIINLLIENGINLTDIDNTGMNLLIYLILENKFDIGMKLVDKLDVNIKDSKNRTALIYSILKRAPIELIKKIIEKGADVNVEDIEGFRPINLAIELEDFDLIRLLIEKGVEPNTKDKDGKTILSRLIEKSETSLILLLLQKNPDVNLKDDKDEAPLSVVLRVLPSEYKIIDNLLEKKALIPLEHLHSMGINVARAMNVDEIIEYIFGNENVDKMLNQLENNILGHIIAIKLRKKLDEKKENQIYFDKYIKYRNKYLKLKIK